MRRLGHEAYSCDILPCSGGHPEWHIQGDVIPLLNGRCAFFTMDGTHHEIQTPWDMIIAHPPCTYLSNAGNAHRHDPGRAEKTEEAASFFMRIVDADCDKIAVENPPGWMNSHYRKADQQIHPYFFSKDIEDANYYMKRTNLWLKNLPKLTYNLSLPQPQPVSIVVREDGSITARHYIEAMSNTADRARKRAKTFPGIARAMAEQWAGNCRTETEVINNV